MLASCGTWISSLKGTPIPPLLQDLPFPFPRPAQDPFTERLRARFPVGSPEADLIHELWLEDFSPVTELQAPQREAEFDTWGKSGFNVCRNSGRVSWSADVNGRVTAVSGYYYRVCP
jgi:hypothetical protein